MRRNRLFAAGVSVALMLGVATPALAKPGTTPPGHAKPPAEKSKAGVSGGGVTKGGAEFSVQARKGRLPKGHFNYTSDTLKVRCKAIDTYTPGDPLGDPAGTITAKCVRFGAGKPRPPIWVRATFFDRAQGGDDEAVPTAVPAPVDGADINFYSDEYVTPYAAMPLDSGDLQGGDVKVRR